MEIEIAKGQVQRLWTKSLVWILSIQVMSALAYHGYASLIPFIQSEYMLTKVQVGYMTSAMFLGSSIISIPSGVVADRIGVRNTLTLFCLILVVVLYMFLFTSNYFAIIALLVCFGIGYGGITPATNRSIMDGFPLQNRGTAMGIKQMGVPLGVVIATFILPFMAHQYSWNISLFVIGNILLLVSLAYFFRNNSDSKVGLAMTNPFAKLKTALSNKKVILLGIVVSFYIGVQVSVTTFIVIYLYQTIKFSLFVSTLCLALVYCGGVLGRGIWGYISDHYFNRQRKKILTFIGLFSGLMLILLGFIKGATPVFEVCVLSFLLGFTTQGWNGIFMTMLSENAEKSDVGITSGVGLTITNFGAIIGTPFAGLIVDLSGSYQMMWWSLSVVIIGVSLIASFLSFESV